MKSTKAAVRGYVSQCRAREIRSRLQHRDSMFAKSDSRRFNLPKKPSTCKKLTVENISYTKNEDLLKCWHSHFMSLSKSRPHPPPTPDIDELLQCSYTNSDDLLDHEIDIKEIETTVKTLKNGKSCGIDDIGSEHLKYGGPSVIVWLKRIFTVMTSLEQIPPCLCNGIVIPIYKGKGRNPLDPNSYRGITLTSTIAKCFEKIILNRMTPILEEQGFPHPSQTAYIRGRSCTDGLFVTNETLHTFARNGDSPYLCLYDLEKAFDSIEYDFLLKHLYDQDINGKTWRLIKFWYQNSTSSVRSNNLVSQPFKIYRGVKQGSALSPTLFNIVLDKLLHDLHSNSSGISISGLSVSAAAHADDVRTCNLSIDSIKESASCLETFTSGNSLKVNVAKTEVVHISPHAPPSDPIDILGSTVTIKKEAKCLGVWWTHDLSSRTSISENINKARRAYFALGSIGAYQGLLNPLTAACLFATFVLPVLLYGCETWYMTDPLFATLDRFQAEIGKRILKLSRYHTNISVRIALHWPSLKSIILYRKLTFLAKLLSGDNKSQSARLFRSLSHDVFSITLVQQCRDLEFSFDTGLLQQCLMSPDDALCIVSKGKANLINVDWNLTLQSAIPHPSLSLVCRADIVDKWNNLWNCALDSGPTGTKLAQTVFKILSRPLFGDRLCPYCTNVIDVQTFPDHLSISHDVDIQAICEAISSNPHNIFGPPLSTTLRQFI